MNLENLPTSIKNYLHKYNLQGWELEIGQSSVFNNIVVIPAIQEYDNIMKLLNSLLDNDLKYFSETLFMFVINNVVNSSEEVKKDNLRSIEFIRQIFSGKTENELAKRISQSKLQIGLVDASTPGKELPEKNGGVGLARKIGMDIALNHFDYANNAKKILICLDADCMVEKNYISEIVSLFNERQMSAAYVQYEHLHYGIEKEKHAIICYEIFLRYYVLGMMFANSPFAFPTIGSTMICDVDSYIKIGGMSKKKAAEDFYFMEKLAKIVPINKIGSTKVYPSSRSSWRVPFGTGQRVNRYFAGTHEEYLLYDPRSFEVLKSWLEIFNLEKNYSTQEYLQLAQSINEGLYNFLLQNSFENDWDNILRQSKSLAQIQKQKIIWFDGFRTLKLIHFLRDYSMPQINMFDSLDQLFKMMNIKTLVKRDEKIPSISVQLEYLNVLRKLT